MAFITNITSTPVTGVYVDGLPSGVDNRHGNIRDGGTIADSDNFSSSAVGEGNPVITIVSGVGPVEGAIRTAGAIFNSGEQVIMVAQTDIAGDTTITTLQGGQSNSANEAYSPLQRTALRTFFLKTAVRAGNWNVFTGAFSSGPTSAVSGAWDIAASADDAADMRAAGTDAAANPTQDAPGQVVFRDGSPNPVQTGYGPRYNW